jgi:hypothetical protein
MPRGAQHREDGHREQQGVQAPVATGIPAILAYPRTSGMPRAASVSLATMSATTMDLRTASTPRSTGSLRSQSLLDASTSGLSGRTF